MGGSRARLAAGTVTLCLAASTLYATAAGLAGEGSIDLALPRPAGASEAVWLQVSVGMLPPGAQLEIRARSGELLGSLSPFATPRGQGAGAYLVPLPESVITNGRVELRLVLLQPGAAPRPPSATEVEDVSLAYVPVTR
jgi:hypothetical protein